MITYSIGQVAKMLGLTAYTLRFYDKEGLLPNVRKNSAGIRRFTEEDVRWLKMMECLKATGMPLKEIRRFMEYAAQGEQTISERLQILINQKENIKNQIKKLKNNAKMIDFKIKYYEESIKYGESQVWNKCPDLVAEYKRLFTD